VVEAGNVPVSLHVEVDQVPFAEVVVSVLEQVVLNEALLYLEAVSWGHDLVSVEVLHAGLLFAELDGSTESVGNSALSQKLWQLVDALYVGHFDSILIILNYNP